MIEEVSVILPDGQRTVGERDGQYLYLAYFGPIVVGTRLLIGYDDQNWLITTVTRTRHTLPDWKYQQVVDLVYGSVDGEALGTIKIDGISDDVDSTNIVSRVSPPSNCELYPLKVENGSAELLMVDNMCCREVRRLRSRLGRLGDYRLIYNLSNRPKWHYERLERLENVQNLDWSEVGF